MILYIIGLIIVFLVCKYILECKNITSTITAILLPVFINIPLLLIFCIIAYAILILWEKRN